MIAAVRRRFVPLALLLLLLAACARTSAPAPVVFGPGAAHPAPQPAPGQARPDTVTVQAGDTLYAVSRRYEVPIRSLIEANNLTPPYNLSAGRRLIVPQVRTHLVQPGETLYAISRRYGVDASALAHANQLDPPFVVKTGQMLILPAPVQVASFAAPATVPSGPAPPSGNPPPFAASAVRQPLAPLPAPDPVRPEPAPIQPAAAPAPVPPPPPSAAPAPSAPPVEEPPPAPPPGKGFVWPVRGRLLSGYGAGATGTHNDGVNIAAPRGTAVLATADGVVAYAGNELRGFGNLVLLKHAGGWMTAYAHCDSIAVKKGDKVRRGQTIARVGETGTVAEPQLHFELRRGTRALDPMGYLAPLPSAFLFRPEGTTGSSPLSRPS
jgi:murein DD-endopeptidase MepM/ murein hydrolase activator NlpD